MEIICINDTFDKPKDWKQWAKQHGIEWPTLNTIYTVRDAIRTFKGLGLLLEEIVNPEVKVNGIKGPYYTEPTFAHHRFTDLQGNPLKINEILESLKNVKLDIALQLVGEDVSNFDI